MIPSIDLAAARLRMLETAFEEFDPTPLENARSQLKIKMNTQIEEVSTRLDIVELAMEVSMATTFLMLDQIALDEWDKNFLGLVRDPVLPDRTRNEQKEAELCQLAVQMAENLMKKVRIRTEAGWRAGETK